MAYEVVQFLCTNKQLPFKKMGAWGAGLGFIAGWVSSGKIGGGIISAIVGLLLAGITWFFKRDSEAIREALRASSANFAERGYNADFTIDNVLIDSKAKVIAFVNTAAKTYDLYSTDDILGWEHQWVNQTSTTTNPLGGTHSRSMQTKNVLVFKTNNPQKPLYKARVSNHQEGDYWMARLNAIFNS